MAGSSPAMTTVKNASPQLLAWLPFSDDAASPESPAVFWKCDHESFEA